MRLRCCHYNTTLLILEDMDGNDPSYELYEGSALPLDDISINLDSLTVHSVHVTLSNMRKLVFRREIEIGDLLRN